MSRALGRLPSCRAACRPTGPRPGRPGEAAQPRDERRIGLPTAAADVGVAEVAGDALANDDRPERRVDDVAERRAQRAPARSRRRGRSTAPRRCRRCSATAGRRRTPCQQHVEAAARSAGRPPTRRGPEHRRRRAPSGSAGRLARIASTIAGIRLDRQPQRRRLVVVESTETIERGAGVLDRDRAGRGPSAASASHTSANSVMHTSSRGDGRRRRFVVTTVDDVAADEEGADDAAPRPRRRRRSGVLHEGSSLQSRRRPGANPRARSRGRRRRACRPWESVRPTLTSAVRATSSSRRAWVRRSRSAVLADSARSRSALASWLSTDATAASVDSLARRPSATSRAGLVGVPDRCGLMAASISSPRLAICPALLDGVVEALADVARAGASAARRRSCAASRASTARERCGALHEAAPRLAEGERVDRRARPADEPGTNTEAA